MRDVVEALPAFEVTEPMRADAKREWEKVSIVPPMADKIDVELVWYMAADLLHGAGYEKAAKLLAEAQRMRAAARAPGAVAAKS